MQKIIKLSDDFWNIRGSFRVGGLLDIGTHISLIRLVSGKFVFLDSYTLSGKTAREVMKLTHDGKDVEAVINLHPFHTIHVEAMQTQFPEAKMYGTERHLSKFPDLKWQVLRSEDEDLHALYADDLEFSVPEGVDFISDDENVHFSSVLAYHTASQTLHVDDTFMYAPLPGLLKSKGFTKFHPTLAKALEPRAGAAKDFRNWAANLNTEWGEAQNLCTAHLATLSAKKNRNASVQRRMRGALKDAERTLKAHERKYG